MTSCILADYLLSLVRYFRSVCEEFSSQLNFLKMPNLFLVQVYGIDAPGGATEIASASGQANLFAGQSPIHVYPTTQTRGVAQVQCNAIVEVLPQGLNQISTKYFTDRTVAQVQALANA
jgi:hypothetical protein